MTIEIRLVAVERVRRSRDLVGEGEVHEPVVREPRRQVLAGADCGSPYFGRDDVEDAHAQLFAALRALTAGITRSP